MKRARLVILNGLVSYSDIADRRELSNEGGNW
ncbi:hypothetical protein HNQ41_002412 [Texcoconibacillus texcoconensis]|uniref:Uncharacterized protein n=1 Tax=Texcoconibacillus texcoconensis TaxID=1095777 RepID=A0A840QSC4_9BACI|nr:hypothetical protein [Texcoconibacillus texcoconensis]